MAARPTMADRLIDAFLDSAARVYGSEAVSELAHSLQCAALARAGGADEDLQLACLLHDVGRFAVDPREIFDKTDQRLAAYAGARGHHEVGADLIAPWVPTRVAWRIRMHADAKRYLCATEPAYSDGLSAGSRFTMTLQGGAMSAEEAAQLARHPWMADAVRLRRWDDLAKVPGKATEPIEAWAPLLRQYFGRARPG